MLSPIAADVISILNCDATITLDIFWTLVVNYSMSDKRLFSHNYIFFDINSHVRGNNILQDYIPVLKEMLRVSNNWIILRLQLEH